MCQCIVVHPPGGIAGGDRLALTVDVGPRAHAQLTTPGATKWYRSGGTPATQQIDFRVADGAVLEWLPQGTIVFDGAQCASDDSHRARARRRLSSGGMSSASAAPRRRSISGRANGGSASTSCATTHSFGASARCCAASRACCLRSRGLERRAGLWHIRGHGRDVRRLIARRLPTPCARARRRRRDAIARSAGRALPRRRERSGARLFRRAVDDAASARWPDAPPSVPASGQPDGTDPARKGQAPPLYGGAGRRASPRRAGSGSTIRKPWR